MTMTTTLRPRNNKATISPSPLLTMSSKALIICLATSSSSCVAYSCGSHVAGRRIKVIEQGHQPWKRRSSSGGQGECRRGLSPTLTKSKTILHYRDGDDDQPLPVQSTNQSAVDRATVMVGEDGASSNPSPSVPDPTKEFVTTPISPMSSNFARSMIPNPLGSIKTLMPQQITTNNNTPSPASTPRDEEQQQQQQQQQQQLVMDEYLEFVQRRYNRLQTISTTSKQPQRQLHKNRHASTNSHIFLSRLTLSCRPFSILPQLTSTPSTCRRIEGKRMEEMEMDPLQALGLSGLASEKLRQRLHVHTHPNMAASGTYPMRTTQDTSPRTNSVTSSIVGARYQIKRTVESIHRIASSFLYSLLVEGGGLRHSARILSVISMVIVAFVSRHVFKQNG